MLLSFLPYAYRSSRGPISTHTCFYSCSFFSDHVDDFFKLLWKAKVEEKLKLKRQKSDTMRAPKIIIYAYVECVCMYVCVCVVCVHCYYSHIWRWIKGHNLPELYRTVYFTIKGTCKNNSCLAEPSNVTGVISYKQICLKQNQATELNFHKTNYQMH